MRLTLLFAAFLTLGALHAQVKVDGKLTGRHADALEETKQARQTAEEKRELARKLKQQAAAKQLFQEKYDSAKAVFLAEYYSPSESPK